ncbi:MAG: (Fe-S)-binding protein [Deltaproteobacteria bacterium]|nr:(Fe-S)-binding protein [Deltaproteobacteria bacterium]MBW1792871.1 (Fe-S)-binding protein [Deltaproteobacteria bacterium]
MSQSIELTELRCELKKKVMELVPDANLNSCLTCGACTSGCPATGQFDLDPRKFLRMVLLGLDEEVMKTPWVWVCTICYRCYSACPMKVDIPQLVYNVRASWPREERPKGIRLSCDYHISSNGSAMGAKPEDFKFCVEDVAEEVRETQPAFKDLQAFVGRKGAELCLNENSRGPVTEPDEMVPLWKILHTVGADWTYPAIMWGGENYCMFLADDKNWEHIVRTLAEHIDNDLGCKVLINTECGHSFYSIWAGLQRFNIPHKFEFKSIVEYYAQWIREGKLRVNSDWNVDNIKFTTQGPCMLVRKSLGDPVAEDLRFVMKSLVGEENFVDMYPNRSNNFCCGGGGGALQAPYNEQRRAYGKIKFDQIMATGAQYVAVPCHNCHAQIEDICEFHGGHYHTIHLWTLICLSLGVLGENERTYLGPDLAEFGL